MAAKIVLVKKEEVEQRKKVERKMYETLGTILFPKASKGEERTKEEKEST